MQSLYNQPIYQQAILNARGGKGRDNRAVGAEREVMGKALRGERERFLGLDIEGSRLAGAKDRLGFAREISTQQNAMARRQLHESKRSDRRATILGGLSTVATGFGNYQNWQRRGTASQRHDDIMRLLYGYKNMPMGQNSFGR